MSTGVWRPAWTVGGQSSGKVLGSHLGGVLTTTILEAPDGRTVVVSAGRESVVVWCEDEMLGRPVLGALSLLATAALTDGRLVAAVEVAERAVRVVDLLSLESIGPSHRVEGSTVTAAAFSERLLGGPWLALGAENGSVGIRAVSDGVAPYGTLDEEGSLEQGAVTSLAWTWRNGEVVLAFGTRNLWAVVWHFSSGHAHLPLALNHVQPTDDPRYVHSGSTLLAASLSNGREILVAAPSGSTEVRVVDIEADELVSTITQESGFGRTRLAVAEVPDGRNLLVVSSGARQGSIRIADLLSGEIIWEEPPFDLPPKSWSEPMVGVGPIAVVSADRPVLVVGWWDRSVRVRDLATGSRIAHYLDLHRGGMVFAVAALRRNGALAIVTGGQDGTVRWWTTPTDLPAECWKVTALDVGGGPGAPAAYVGFDDGAVAAYDVPSGRRTVGPMAAHDGPVRAVMAPIGSTRHGMSLGADDTLRTWDSTTLAPVGEQRAALGANAAAMASDDGGPLVVTVGRETVIWRPEGAHSPQIVDDPNRDERTAVLLTLRSVDVVAPRRRWWRGGAVVERRTTLVSVTGVDGELLIADAESGARLAPPLIGHTDDVIDIAAVVLPAGEPVDLSAVVSAGADGLVRVWDLDRHQPRGPVLTGHVGPVRAVTTLLLANGRPVAVSGGADATLRLWDLLTMTPCGTPFRLPAPVTAIAAWHQGDDVGVLVGGEGVLTAILVDPDPAGPPIGTISCSVRTDGFYLSKADPDVTDILRFHPSGQCFSASIFGRCDLAMVAQWLGPAGRDNASGPFDCYGPHVDARTISSGESPVDYRGTVLSEGEVLRLERHSHLTGLRTELLWRFAPVRFPRRNA